MQLQRRHRQAHPGDMFPARRQQRHNSVVRQRGQLPQDRTPPLAAAPPLLCSSVGATIAAARPSVAAAGAEASCGGESCTTPLCVATPAAGTSVQRKRAPRSIDSHRSCSAQASNTATLGRRDILNTMTFTCTMSMPVTSSVTVCSTCTTTHREH